MPRNVEVSTTTRVTRDVWMVGPDQLHALKNSQLFDTERLAEHWLRTAGHIALEGRYADYRVFGPFHVIFTYYGEAVT